MQLLPPSCQCQSGVQNMGDGDEQGGSGDHANGVQRSGSGLGRNAPKGGRGRPSRGRGQMRGDMGMGGPMAPMGGMMGGMQAMPGQMFVLAPGKGPLRTASSAYHCELGALLLINPASVCIRHPTAQRRTRTVQFCLLKHVHQCKQWCAG